MKRLTYLLFCLILGIGVATAQTTKVTGIVISADDNEPIVGASIAVKGTALGTVSNYDGTFSLEVPSSAKTLVVTYVGMEPMEVAVKPNLRLVMKSDTQMLDEVMVVAYGTAKKSSFTGSASTIKTEKIAVRQTSNVTNALAGQVAGVQITSGNGQPGTSATVRIRGIGSMAASNDPLYVVDGVPYDGDIASINTQDIESMTVLKDAAANSLYGARGANGVILITTKKGKSGQAVVRFDAKWGTNRRAVPTYDVIKDPATYYETAYRTMYNNRIANGSTPEEANAFANKYIFSNEEGGVGYRVYSYPQGESFIGLDGKINPNATLGYSDGEFYYTPDDWYDELFDKGNLRQEYNLNVSGASDKMSYYFSAGYLDDSGLIPNSGFTRISTRLNADYQVKKWLKIGANMSYINSESLYPANQTSTGSTSNIFAYTDRMGPIYPLYIRDKDGNIKKDRNGFTMYDFGDYTSTNFKRTFLNGANPASLLALDKRNYDANVFSGKWFAQLDIFKGLKLQANIGVDADDTRSKNLYNAWYGQYSATGGIIYVTATRTMSVNQQYLLTYNNTFGKHNIDVLAGFENYDYKYQYLRGSKENLYNPNISEINNAINKPTADSYTSNYGTQGWLGRVQYDYDGKYFGSVSYRRDASSRFHPDNRWGNFWSVGAGWLLNKERFLEGVEWIDMLKYKISYGVQGNDNLGNYYPYQDQYSVSESNGSFATTLSYKGNKDITWETSHSFNTGFDFALFDNRLKGTAEVFTRKTTDMLYNMPVAPSLGYSSMPINVGSMKNVGVEIDLNGEVIRTRDFNWSISLNLTHFKNKILELESSLNGEMIDGSYIYREGESRYQFYLREYAGVDPETGVALYYKDILDKDKNVTGREKTSKYSEATQYGSGDILPKVYGGFGTTFNFKGFDLSLAFAYQLGGRIYDNSYAAFMHKGDSYGAGTNWHKDILKAWTPENKNSNIPRLNYTDQYSTSLSTRFLTSSDYLSLQNITFGYTLPSKLTNKFSIGSLRLYLVADNVALISARKGLDPRQSYTTANTGVYSPIRTLSGGVSVSF